LSKSSGRITPSGPPRRPRERRKTKRPGTLWRPASQNEEITRPKGRAAPGNPRGSRQTWPPTGGWPVAAGTNEGRRRSRPSSSATLAAFP
jgi:hypothetical protein